MRTWTPLLRLPSSASLLVLMAFPLPLYAGECLLEAGVTELAMMRPPDRPEPGSLVLQLAAVTLLTALVRRRGKRCR